MKKSLPLQQTKVPPAGEQAVYHEEETHAVSLSHKLQQALWDEYVAWHNNVIDSCCPDMSCCGNVPWTLIQRTIYTKAAAKAQGTMRDVTRHTARLLKTVLTKPPCNPVDPLYKIEYIPCPDEPGMAMINPSKLPVVRLAYELQIELWKLGYSWHNNVVGECCPDMSCCGNTIWPSATREIFLNADETAQMSMCMGALGEVLGAHGLADKVYVAGTMPNDQDTMH